MTSMIGRQYVVMTEQEGAYVESSVCASLNVSNSCIMY